MQLPIHRNHHHDLICIVYIIGGSFIDDLAFMILATPIFFPAVLKLGFDPIWFGIMIGITQMVGIVIPPVASAVFIVHKLSKTPMAPFIKGWSLSWSASSSFAASALYISTARPLSS